MKLFSTLRPTLPLADFPLAAMGVIALLLAALRSADAAERPRGAAGAQLEWLTAAFDLGPPVHGDRVALERDLARKLTSLGAAGGDSPLAIAQALHGQLHARLLNRYEAEVCDLHSLSAGRFNCVSATLAFVCAAPATMKWEVRQWVGHVAPAVWQDDQWWLIEIASDQWRCAKCEPGSRVIGMRELAAAMWFNRAVRSAGRNDFADSLSAYDRALQLDPACLPAAANRLATINNWAVALAAAGRRREAFALLVRGLGEAPEYQLFAANRARLSDPGESRPTHASER